MATKNSINLEVVKNADGYSIAGGTTKRTLTVIGGNATITGGGAAVISFPTATSTLATLALAETFTDKRIHKRVPSTTQSATPTINTDTTDVVHIVGLAQAITSMTTNLTGTPIQGEMLRFSITDNGTARAITWGSSFEASGTVALPTTTVVNVRLDVGFVWNTVTSKWRCIATA